MKSSIKKLSLVLIIIIVLGISFGCGKNTQPEHQSKVIVSTNLGFVSDLTQEDSKNYVVFGFDGSHLKLEVEDLDVFNNIEKDEFYRFSFDRNDVLLSIDKDNYIKELVLKSMEQGVDDEDPVTKNYISSESKVSTEGLALLDSYKFDINGDGVEEIISMYVNAEQSSDGEVHWDDGQDWLFLVEGQEQDYVLFNDYVQLGDIRFHIYTIDDDFYITTIQSGTANLGVTEYKFDQDTKEFVSTLKHEATGNVNMLHTSFGY